MKFQIQENEVAIVNLGATNGPARKVTFSVGGTTVEREILLSEDRIVSDNPEEFYMHNKEAIEKNIIDYLSENQMYNEK